MRYGCVVTLDQIGEAVAAGFDYIELPARELQPEGNHELAVSAVSQALFHVHRPIKVEVFSDLLSQDLAIVGPNVDQVRLQRYLHRVFTDMWALGGVLVVLGNAASRRIPEGFSYDEAAAQFVQAIAFIQNECTRNGLDLVLEPINHGETNLLNTLEESCRFLNDHKVPDVRLLADLYHLTMEGEPLDSLQSCSALIAHVHIADTDRLPPGQGNMDFGEFFTALHRIGYDERISINCNWHNFVSEAGPALAFVKEQWEANAITLEAKG